MGVYQGEAVKLHVCCGKRYLDGWVNIDVVAPIDGPAPDILAHAKSIPLESGVADELMCIHGWEHFYRWECDAVMNEWIRLLKPGGRIVLELPDLHKCCRNILQGKGDTGTGEHEDQMGMWGLYGDPRMQDPFMVHRWGWHPKSLGRFLKEAGFVDIREEIPQFHRAGRLKRDMRLVARRPGK